MPVDYRILGSRGGGGSSAAFDVYPMSPGDFVATATGTPPTLTNNNNCQVWSFADAAIGEIVSSFFLPTSFRQISVGFFWVNPGPDVTGNARWRVALKKLNTTDLTSSGFDVDTTADVASGAVNAVTLRPNHITGFDSSPGPFGSTYSLLISRIGNHANDTIDGNAVEFHSLSLQRTG